MRQLQVLFDRAAGTPMTALIAGSSTQWPRDLLRISDLGLIQLDQILDLAARMKMEPRAWFDSHRGESLAMVCETPSTRTRVSFAAAAERLGMLPIALSPADLQLGRRETVEDTAHVLSTYASAVAARALSQHILERMASAATIPVINALSDDHHPCQALADVLTLREHFGRLQGLTVAYSGDGRCNVVHSLIEVAALSGMHVRIASPVGRRPNRGIVRRARDVAGRSGGSITITDDAAEAVAGADAVYAYVGVWMEGEESEQARRHALRPYRVTTGLMASAAPRAIFLHCLPTNGGEEVEAAVVDGPASAVRDQAANRLPTEEAILHLVISAAEPARRQLAALSGMLPIAPAAAAWSGGPPRVGFGVTLSEPAGRRER